MYTCHDTHTVYDARGLKPLNRIERPVVRGRQLMEGFIGTRRRALFPGDTGIVLQLFIVRVVISDVKNRNKIRYNNIYSKKTETGGKVRETERESNTLTHNSTDSNRKINK